METVMSKTAELIQSLVAGGERTSELDSSNNSEELAMEEGSQESEANLPEGEDAPKDSSDELELANSEDMPGKADQKISGNKEVITISDEKGRRKVEIDFSNKDQLKKYVQLAYGARKWQAERDQSKQEASSLKQQLSEMKTNWDTVENKFRSKGVEGLVDLLEGRDGAYREWLQKQLDRQDFIRRASPEELEALQSKELAETKSREAERLRKEFEDFKKEVMGNKEETELQSTYSRVTPVFDRYRFAGKLGDEVHESKLDKLLWNSALESLEPYEDKGIDLTPEMIEKAFRSEAQILRSMIGKQAEKKANKVIEKKKQEATENVQARVMSGYKTGETAKEAQDMLRSGNLKGIFQNWNKYSKVFKNK